MIVLGVDPGATATGLVVRDTDSRDGGLLEFGTHLRPDDERDDIYLDGLLTLMLKVTHMARPPELVAVEAVSSPNPYHRGERRMLNPKHAISTALAAGAAVGWAWAGPVPFVFVPAGHNGQGAMDVYPEQLRPTRGQGKGSDALRHCRAAWDVAGLGVRLRRQEVPG